MNKKNFYVKPLCSVCIMNTEKIICASGKQNSEAKKALEHVGQHVVREILHNVFH
ncbi:MAG: hypothetical protein KBS99_07655 [Prevotellaceae bacterium]|nr:hypothetical protein [Candidatus Colivivens caballi]